MPIDPVMAATVMRVVEAINQRDRRARGLAAPPSVGTPPELGLGYTPPPPPPAPVVNALFNQLGGALHDAVLPRPAIGMGSAPPHPILAPVGPIPNRPVGMPVMPPTITTATGGVLPLPGPLPTAATQPTPASGPGPPTLDVFQNVPSPGDLLGGAVQGAKETFFGPQNAVKGAIGEETYQFVMGNRNVYGPLAPDNAIVQWAQANPDVVKQAHDTGYRSRDGTESFTGGRAVWEAFAREHLTGNAAGAAMEIFTDPWNLVGGPLEVGGKAVARGGARFAAEHPEDALRVVGRAAEGLGLGVAATDRAYQATAALIPKAIGAGARGMGRGVNRVAPQVGRWFEASPSAKALRDLNDSFALWAQRKVAEARAPGTFLDPHGISPGAVPDAIGEVATALPPRYEEALSPQRSTRADATTRARDRLMTLADAAPAGEARDGIHAIWDTLAQTRDDILATTETGRPGGRDIRNAANRYELWSAELEAERAARQVLVDAGITPPPYRNRQPRNSVASALDTLAWNPDDTAATAARTRLLGEETGALAPDGTDTVVSASLRDARQAAEANRVDIEAAPTPPAAAPTPPAETIDAHLEGMPEPDKSAWRAALQSQNGRSVDFQAVDARLRQAYQRVEAEFTAPGTEDTVYRTAAREYQDAWQVANRLLEATKREDDDILARFAAGGITPPDVQDAILGGGAAARDAMDLADRSFTLGPIEAPEVGAGLARTFQRNPQYLNRAIGDVMGEIETRVTADKNRLLQLLSRAETSLTSKETTELTKLKKRYPHITDLADASHMSVPVELRREMHGAFTVEHAADQTTRVGRTLDTMSRIYQRNLLMPWSIARYWIGNLTGDTAQIALVHGIDAALAANDPVLLADMIRAARSGGDPTVGAVGDLARAAGLGGFHGQLVTENLAQAIWRREQTALNRAGGRARFNLLGTIDQATGRITDLPRNLANGLEWAHRTGLWAFLFRADVPARKAGWVRELAPLAEKHGLQESTLRQLIDGLPDVVDGSEVASALSREALSRGVAADAAKGLAEEGGRRWASEVYKADESARAGVNKALFSYEQKTLDAWTRRIIPYHMWQSRAIPFYAEQALRHPGFAAAYYQLYQSTKEAAETEGWPAPLRTMVALWHGPGGMLGMVNPIAMIGLLDFAFETNGGYTNEHVSAVGQVFQRASDYGATLLPWWGGALNLAGYMGDSPLNLDPIGTSQARRWVGAQVQVVASELAAHGIIGPEWQRLLDKPYDQKLQDLRGVVSGWAPGSVEIPVNDPNAMPAREIRNILLRNELAQRGMTLNQYLQLAAEAGKDSSGEAGVLLEDIHATVAAEEQDAGAPYKQAVREWSQSNALATAVNSIIPGPKAVRQEEGMAIQGLANTAFAAPGEAAVIPGVGPLPTPGHDPSDLVDARDADFTRKWRDRFGADYRTGDLKRMQDAALDENTLQNASPESSPYLEQQNAYHALGTERERGLLQTHDDIAYARTGIVMPNRRANGRVASGRHAGLTYISQETLASLDQQTRYDLADAWLAAVDRDGEVARVRELRDLYEQTHPEFGGYQAWQRGTRKQWGTADAFRQAAVRANPNYARFIAQETAKLRAKGETPSEIAADLETTGLSLDAYFAYMGMRGSRYDPAPLELGTPLPVASEGATGEGMAGSGGSSGQSWAARVQQALTDTEAAMQASQQYLGVRLDQLPPQFADAYLAQPDFPEAAKPPSDYWIYQDYLNFANEQSRAGGDTSVEAFIASTSHDPTQAAPQYQAGVWPPQELPAPRHQRRSPR